MENLKLFLFALYTMACVPLLSVANETETYFCYNSEFADTVAQLEEVDLRDENVYSPIDYDGQIPVPKCQAITDMDAGVKAIEYFIRTGMRYPGIDWGYCP